MKKYILLLCVFLSAGYRLNAADDSDSLGLPGDNLDLYGVLDLFKASSSLEDFEKKLNDPANEVNNLDLNDDQNVDYIRVVDNTDADVHAITLQIPVSATEAQDVAVIELEKTGAEEADLQVVGDEELYGEDYIIEASAENNSGSTDQKWQGFRPMPVVVNVFMWPCVRYVYAPAYVVWVSPWQWMYYPVWWRPWHPVMWHVHHTRVMHYHSHYVCVHHYRMTHAHGYYHGHRVASPSVHHRYEANHQRHAANNQQAQRTNNSPQRTNAQRPPQGGRPNHGTAERPKQSSSGHSTSRPQSPRSGKKATQGNVQKRPSGGNGNAQKRPASGGGGQKRGGGGRR